MTYTFEVTVRLSNGGESRITMSLHGDTSGDAERILEEIISDDTVVLEFKEVPMQKNSRKIVGRDYIEVVKGDVRTGTTHIVTGNSH